MPPRDAEIREQLRAHPERWLVTGAAGFVGAHLVRGLLELGQSVVGLDSFATGRRARLDALREQVGARAWLRFSLLEGDVRDRGACAMAVAGVDRVLHQAALGSVPGSIEHPHDTHTTNVDGLVNVALAARAAGARAFVYASSASVYGPHVGRPHQESAVGTPQSPYAATKRMGELYAQALTASSGWPTVGLRYFNVVGPGADPDAPHPLVVPRWLAHLRGGRRPVRFGTGPSSRDFVAVGDVVRANLLAAMGADRVAGRVFNVGRGQRTELDDLFVMLRDGLAARGAPCRGLTLRVAGPRPGDVAHSEADLTLARADLGYEPLISLDEALGQAMDEVMARPVERSRATGARARRSR